MGSVSFQYLFFFQYLFLMKFKLLMNLLPETVQWSFKYHQQCHNLISLTNLILYAELYKFSLKYCTYLQSSCSTFSTYSTNPFCFTFQRAALDCTTVGWGSCTLIGVNSEMSRLTISPVELIMGRTINGTCFGGQFFSLLIYSIVVCKFFQ